jgi:hypothetical protein
MLTESLKLSQTDVRKLLSAASPDGALLYIYLKSGNRLEMAENDLGLSPSRLSCAAALLRQLGLLPQERPAAIAPGERPTYTDEDVYRMMDYDPSFKGLYEEVQRLLGRSLNNEELKILLGFVRFGCFTIASQEDTGFRSFLKHSGKTMLLCLPIWAVMVALDLAVITTLVRIPYLLFLLVLLPGLLSDIHCKLIQMFLRRYEPEEA